MSFYVYILASQRNGTLYTGMTDDLVRRAWQHRTGAVPGFTSDYGVNMLVWYEQHENARICLGPRTSNQEMESGLETEAHRGDEFRVA